MKSKKQKREEALIRRRNDLEYWKRQKPVQVEDAEDLAYNESLAKSIQTARRDITALEKKLGYAVIDDDAMQGPLY